MTVQPGCPLQVHSAAPFVHSSASGLQREKQQTTCSHRVMCNSHTKSSNAWMGSLLPTQFTRVASSSYASGQLHSKLPGLLVHVASQNVRTAAHPHGFVADSVHSSISVTDPGMDRGARPPPNIRETCPKMMQKSNLHSGRWEATPTDTGQAISSQAVGCGWCTGASVTSNWSVGTCSQAAW